MFFNSGVGINIEDHKAVAAYVKGSFKGANLIAESSLVLDQSKPISDKIQDIAEFINAFMREHKISSAGIFIGIPGHYCMFREVDFPMAVKENLKSALEYEIEKYIPLSAEDIYFDYQIVSEDKAQESLTVLLSVVKKENAESYVQLAELLEYGGSGIETAPAAISNYFMHQLGAVDDPTVIVHISEIGIDLIFIRRQVMLYSRTLPYPDPESELHGVIISHLDQIRNMFCKDGERVNLYFYGKKIEEELSRELTEAHQFDLLAPTTGNEKLSGAKSIPAIGLALRGMGKLPVQMNLMPPHLRKKMDKTSLIVMTALMAIFTLSLIFLAVSHVLSQRTIMTSLDQELEKLRSEAANIENIKAQTQNIQDRLTYLASLRPGGVYVSDALKELTEIIPKTTWVREMQFFGNQISLYGSSGSASELIPLLDASPIFTDVKFLSTIRKDKDDKDIFRIGLQIH